MTMFLSLLRHFMSKLRLEVANFDFIIKVTTQLRLNQALKTQ